MEKETGPTDFKGFVQWATTPPQAYAVYFVLLLLVGGTSFFAGTLSPKKTAGMAPAPISSPRN